jgi:outer membrane murein-binding lipoprotein Lpp
MKMQLESQIERTNELTDELNAIKEELAEKVDKLDKKEKKFKEDLTNAKRDSEKAKKDL